jgi:hypothetical protein
MTEQEDEQLQAWIVKYGSAHVSRDDAGYPQAYGGVSCRM